MNYFLDSSAILKIYKLKKNYSYIFNFPMIYSSQSKTKFLLKLPWIKKMFKNSVNEWKYLDNKNFNSPPSRDVEVLMTALDYEETCCPDNMIYITGNATMAHVANLFFGDDSIIFI